MRLGLDLQLFQVNYGAVGAALFLLFLLLLLQLLNLPVFAGQLAVLVLPIRGENVDHAYRQRNQAYLVVHRRYPAGSQHGNLNASDDGAEPEAVWSNVDIVFSHAILWLNFQFRLLWIRLIW